MRIRFICLVLVLCCIPCPTFAKALIFEEDSSIILHNGELLEDEPEEPQETPPNKQPESSKQTTDEPLPEPSKESAKEPLPKPAKKPTITLPKIVPEPPLPLLFGLALSTNDELDHRSWSFLKL